MTYDVRAVANFVLDCAAETGRGLTNIDINKIVYFLHGWYIAKYSKPLVTAKIEAWKLGPVFRELYREFRVFESLPIGNKAQKVNIFTGEKEVCDYSFTEEEERFLRDLASKYLRISTHGLVALSHETGGPWDVVWQEERPGMQITDDLIRDYFSSQVRN